MLQKLRHGRSPIVFHPQQRELSYELLRCAVGATKPLLDRIEVSKQRRIDSFFSDFQTHLKQNGQTWFVKNPDSAKGALLSIIETLLPVRWSEAKQLPKPVNTKQVAGLEEIELSYTLRKFCVWYLNGQLPEKNDYFLSALKSWTTKIQSEGIQNYKALNEIRQQSNEHGIKLIHPAFALTFTAINILHDLQRLSGVEKNAETRARTGYALECYRYYSLVSEGIPVALLEYQSKKGSNNQDYREFKKYLYSEKFPLDILSKQLGIDESAPSALPRSELRVLAPKIERVLKVVKRELDRGRIPFISCHINLVREVLALYLKNEGLNAKLVMIDATHNHLTRENAWKEIGKDNAIVVLAGEVTAPTVINHVKPITVIPITQHPVPLTDYPFVLSLREGGGDVKVVPIIGNYSPDAARRKRVKPKDFAVKEYKRLSIAMTSFLDGDEAFKQQAMEDFISDFESVLKKAQRKKDNNEFTNGLVEMIQNRLSSARQHYGSDHLPLLNFSIECKNRTNGKFGAVYQELLNIT
jgi:hypothetical protein